jgi:hypothetical protein
VADIAREIDGGHTTASDLALDHVAIRECRGEPFGRVA